MTGIQIFLDFYASFWGQQVNEAIDLIAAPVGAVIMHYVQW